MVKAMASLLLCGRRYSAALRKTAMIALAEDRKLGPVFS